MACRSQWTSAGTDGRSQHSTSCSLPSASSNRCCWSAVSFAHVGRHRCDSQRQCGVTLCCAAQGDSAEHGTPHPDDLPQPQQQDVGEGLQHELQVAAARMRAFEEYSAMMALPDADIDLLRAAVLIARHRYPLASTTFVECQIQEIVELVEEQLPHDGSKVYPLRLVRAINAALYDELGYCGNKDDYYNADNSCINQVLHHRKGIPITLAVVYMEVAKRVGLPMTGVNLPSHFMLRPLIPESEILIDVYDGGEICFVEDVEERLASLWGMPVRMNPSLLADDHRMRPRDILYRMLNNLKQIYIASQMVKEALLITQYMRVTLQHAHDVRDEGLCLYALGRYRECAAAMQLYLQMSPNAEDASVVMELLRKIEGHR